MDYDFTVGNGIIIPIFQRGRSTTNQFFLKKMSELGGCMMALWFDKLDFFEKVAGLSHSGRPLKHQKLAFDKQKNWDFWSCFMISTLW